MQKKIRRITPTTIIVGVDIAKEDTGRASTDEEYTYQGINSPAGNRYPYGNQPISVA